jgi:hypothetical protein
MQGSLDSQNANAQAPQGSQDRQGGQLSHWDLAEGLDSIVSIEEFSD